MSLLEVRELRSAYGGVVALWDVSFEVAEGQVVTLLGSNGAGKTTTLRTISGLMTAQSGSIRFAGRKLGQDNEPIFFDRLGLSREEYEAMREDGVI